MAYTTETYDILVAHTSNFAQTNLMSLDWFASHLLLSHILFVLSLVDSGVVVCACRDCELVYTSTNRPHIKLHRCRRGGRLNTLWQVLCTKPAKPTLDPGQVRFGTVPSPVGKAG